MPDVQNVEAAVGEDKRLPGRTQSGAHNTQVFARNYFSTHLNKEVNKKEFTTPRRARTTRSRILSFPHRRAEFALPRADSYNPRFPLRRQK